MGPEMGPLYQAVQHYLHQLLRHQQLRQGIVAPHWFLVLDALPVLSVPHALVDLHPRCLVVLKMQRVFLEQ
jgi:hypothetical protein